MKKVLAVLLAAAMCLAMIPMLALAAGTGEEPETMVTVHAKVPEDWTTPHAYAWKDGGDPFEAWPGGAMTAGTDGWWTIQIPAWADRLIINNGNGGPQTVDLVIPEPGKDVYVQLSATPTAGKYQATITTQAPTENDPIEPEKMVTVHAKVPTEWTNPCAWAWKDGGAQVFDTWPGGAMTAGTDGWWTVQIPAWADRLIINNNGAPQTVDLTIPEPGKDVYVEVTSADGQQATISSQAPTTETDPTDPTAPSDEPTTPSDEPTTPTDAPDPTDAPNPTDAPKPTEAPKPSEMVTVLAKVPEDWKNPGVWAWKDGGDSVFEKWPGGAMTAGKDGWWTIQIPAWADRLIINANNGTYQTEDLTIAELGKDIKVEVTVVDGKAQAAITYSAPSTGDQTMLVAGTALLVLAAAGIGALVIARKKKLF